MRKLLKVFFVLCIPLLFPLGCGSDDPASPAGSSLDDVTLAVTGVVSLGRVDIVGIPTKAALSDLQVLVGIEGGDEAALPVDEDEIGPYFYAPLHPITPNQGGPVLIQVTDGIQRSPELPLDLEALPEAPGAYARVVTALRAQIDQRAAWAGTDFETLAAMPYDDVDLALLPLRAAVGYLDGEGPGDLQNLVTDAAGYMTTDERELLDRIFGHAPLDELIQAEVDTFASGGLPPPPPPPPPGAARSTLDCFDVGPSITNAEQLSHAMIASAKADLAINPDSAPGRTLGALGAVLAGGGVLPGYGKVFSTIGVGVASWTATADFIRSVYPSSLVHLAFDIDRTEFNEDETQPATWSNVQVIAASTGWRATRSIADVVISSIGAYVSLSQKLAIERLEVLRDAAIAGSNMAYGEYLDGQDGGIEFCAKTWDVDITGQPWSTGGVSDRKFDVDPATQQVRPLEVGSDVLTVATQSSQFGGREVQDDRTLLTKFIVVDVSPAAIVVEQPGEVVNINAEIRNANDETLYWGAEAGSWQDGQGVTTPGSATRPLSTPTDEDFYPFNVRIESMSRDGLREGGLPARFGLVNVRLEQAGIRIDPQHDCIQPGETRQFTAVVTGLEDYEVHWEVVSGWGSIDQNGLYQSLGEGTSNAEISAEIVDRPELIDRAWIDVQGCACSLTVVISGDANWSAGSADVIYMLNDFEDLVYQWLFEIPQGDGPLRMISASLMGSPELPAPEPGNTGSWPVNFGVFIGGQSWLATQEDDDYGVDLILTELSGSSMAGSFVGDAVQRDENGDVISLVGVDVQFRAALWDGGQWPCE